MARPLRFVEYINCMDWDTFEVGHWTLACDVSCLVFDESEVDAGPGLSMITKEKYEIEDLEISHVRVINEECEFLLLDLNQIPWEMKQDLKRQVMAKILLMASAETEWKECES